MLLMSFMSCRSCHFAHVISFMPQSQRFVARAAMRRIMAQRRLDDARRLSKPCSPQSPQQRVTAPSPAEGSPSAARRRTVPHFAVIGFHVGIDDRNRDRRALLRELWYPEYANLGPQSAVRAEFIIGLLTYQGDGHDEATVRQLHDEHVAHGDLALVNARERRWVQARATHSPRLFKPR